MGLKFDFMRKRSTFGSRFGTVAVVGGSVIGLGNIWRFPYVVGENGGATFIIIFIIISFLVSVPIMLAEFSIGRNSKRNSMRAFRKLSRVRAWEGVGYLGIITAFTILSFYSVIAGWSLEFIRESVAGTFMKLDPQQVNDNFYGFVHTGWQPALWTAVFVAATALIVGSGIEKGIERFNKAAMPLMFVILILMCINSFTLSGFREGVEFLFKPDREKLNLHTVLNALGQSFFSLSLGMGIMVTYGSYIKKSQNMFKISGMVVVADMLIAVLCGLAIFPAVFSFGISPSSGYELVFLTLPNIFAQMAGGQILAFMFFVLLLSAAITSSVSLMEVVVAYVYEEFRMKRRTATVFVAAATMAMAILCAVSQMPGSSLRIAGMDVFDFFDHITSTYMIPLGGFLIVLFTGWAVKGSVFRNELTNGGLYGAKLYPGIMAMIKYVIPFLIAILFLNQIGMLKW